MNIVVLWPNIPQYIGACLNELISNNNNLLVIEDESSNSSNKNYLFKESKSCKLISLDNYKINENELIKIIIDFNVDLILMSLSCWGFRYKIDKILHKKSVFLIAAVDAFKHNTKRELLFSFKFNLLRKNNFDAIFVPGYRSFLYAKSLGFSDNQIFEGLYTCDSNLFTKIGNERIYNNKAWPKVFIFIGQYIKRKGLDVLLKAYEKYREEVEFPWELWCIGDGPLKILLNDLPGVKDFGYLTQEETKHLMKKSGALVIPSIEDHWPLVIHEATCAGLPIIASRNTGSIIELVQNGINGYIHNISDIYDLTEALKYVSLNDASKMGYESFLISKNYSVEKWNEILVNFIPKLKKDIKNIHTN